MNYTHTIDTENFKGSITVKMLPWKERIAKSKEIIYKIEDGKFVNRESFETYDLSMELAISNTISVDLVQKENNKEIKSIDELMIYREGIEIMSKISTTMINGVSLAKN